MWNINQNKITFVIAASFLALIVLILFQVQWMQQSRDLLEEQFDQKVDMALCEAVKDMESTEETTVAKSACKVGKQPATCAQKIDDLIESPDFDQKISSAFDFYKIGMDYEATIVNKNSIVQLLTIINNTS